jgi:hypothetical protein
MSEKQYKTITVTTIMYRGDDCGNKYEYQDTTLLPFNKWLEEHNKNREGYFDKKDLKDDYWKETEDNFEWFKTTFSV